MTENKQDTQFERPPFFNSWKAIYLLVLANLLVLIVLFYWFSVSF